MIRFTRNQRFLIALFGPPIFTYGIYGLSWYLGEEIEFGEGLWGLFQRPEYYVGIMFLPLAFMYNVKPIMWWLNFPPFDEEEE